MAKWLDDLTEHARKPRKRKKADVVPAGPPPVPPVVREVIVSVRPSDDRTGDPGEAAAGWFTLEALHNGMFALTMCDENGKPLGEKSETVTEADAEIVAARLTKRRWATARSDGDDFDRPLNYGPAFGVV